MTEKIGPKDGAVKARQSPRSREAGNADGQKSTSSAKTASKGRGKQNKRAPKIPYEPDQIAEIFRRFAVQRPEPESELEHSNPFTLLVAVVLSAQATDAGVNKATRGLFASADTPEAMAALGEDAIRDHIKTIGLYRNKAKNVLALSEALIARHGGAVPRERAALEALPGVGRKTANVVLNVAFGEETLAVDTHIFRIGNRLKLAPGKTPDEVEARLLPAALSPPCPSLADPAWPLCLQGAQTRLRGLRDRRSLSGGREDDCSAGRAHRAPRAPSTAARVLNLGSGRLPVLAEIRWCR